LRHYLMSEARRVFASKIPSTLTLIRALATSILFVTLLEGGWGFPIFIAACLTDVFDGFLARRLHVTSEAGGVFDASVDFMLVSSTTMYLVLTGLVSEWFLALIILAFSKYLLFREMPDPLGKHIGTILFVCIGTILMYPTQFVANWSCFLASGYMLTAVTLSARASNVGIVVESVCAISQSLSLYVQ
jgi:phosphatidylglycerophosphate synthase